MRIETIELRNYRGIESASVEFDDVGVTILQGPNEVGKSSVIEAFNLLLDERDDTSKQAVKATQSIGVDAGPSITAVFRTGDFLLKYHKQWLKGKETTLEILEPTVENLTGREAHERVEEILSKTVDEVLWRALQFQQGKPHGQQLGNSVSLTNALDEAAGGAGGDRSDESESLWESVVTEYGKYFYKSGKPNAELSTLNSAISAAEDKRSEALATLEAVNDDVVAHDRLLADIDALEESEIAAEERKTELEKEWAALKGTVARSLELEHQLASEIAIAGQSKLMLEQRDGLAQKVENARAEHLALEQKHAAKSEGREGLEKERLETLKAVEAATTARKSAEQRASLASNDEAHLRRQQEVSMMAERAERAGAAAKQISEYEAELVGLLVDDPALERITVANKRKVEAEARALAVSYRVKISAHKNAAIVANEESIEIEAGSTAEVVGASGMSIAVEDLVELRIEGTNEQRDLSTDAEAATTELVSILEQFCVDAKDGIEAASKINRRRQTIQTELTGLRAAQQNDLRDLTTDELSAKVERGRQDITEYKEDREDLFELASDIEAAVATKEAEEQALLDARAGEAEAIQSRDLVNSRLSEIAQVEAADVALIANAQSRMNTEVAALDAARKLTSDSELTAAQVAAQAKVEKTQTALAAIKEDLSSRNAESVEANLPNAVKSLERNTADLAAARLKLEGYKGKLESVGQQGLQDVLDSAESDLEHAHAAKRRFETRAAAAELLYKTLAKNRDSANQHYVAPFKDRVDTLGRLVFAHSASFEVDPGTLAISALTRDDKRIPFESLSAGAKEQTEMIATLATAQLVSPASNGGGAGVPVVFDDALGASDRERLVAMSTAIAVASEDCQVIVLTCDSSRYQHIGEAKVVAFGIDT